MIANTNIQGKFVTLCPTQIADASFAIKIRRSEKAAQYLHYTSDNLSEQEKWIATQREKENDYNFTVFNKKDEKIGLVALYNIDGKEAELGRWCSFGNAFENLETVCLLHDWGFQELNLEEIYSCTMKDNKKVVSFWRKFGAKFVEEIDTGYISIKNATNKSTYYTEIWPLLSKMLGRS